MPELPEVETTLRGIEPYITGQTITNVIIRHFGLRWPIPCNLREILIGQTINNLTRRAKYLLLSAQSGHLIIHLGMSGKMSILKTHIAPSKHDHVDLEFNNGICLRFNDPRRFGAYLWTDEDPDLHPLLKELGPEPLTAAFTAQHLWRLAQNRKVPVKSFIMSNHIVVGVGNIYAAEALFDAGIDPRKPAGKISIEAYQLLVAAIKKILRAAIKKGGTTLKDFLNTDGKKGYFSINLKVYGRGKLPCVHCDTELQEIRLGQRSTVFCPKCQG
jgi:formamidopyrimidine-DNA glycosylase